jgi:benzoate-CoA ligase
MKPTFPESFNLAHYFLDHNLEAGRGEKVCLYFEDRTFTYRQMHELANRTGNVLRDLGARLEDRVLLVLPDCPEFVATWFGTLKIGAVFAMVNPALPAENYDYYLDYTRARVAVVHESSLEQVEPALAHARHLENVLVVGKEGHRHASFAREAGRASPALENERTSRDDVAGWLFTSGSTGKPKAAVHYHHDFAYNTECYAKQVLKIAEDDLTLSVPKLFFGYATGTNLMFPFAVGAATVLFTERATAPVVFDAIERYRPTVLTSVPTMINAMVQEPDASERRMSSLRCCISAGEALPPELYRRWKEMFGVEILDGIGSAELFHIYISNRFDDIRPGSLGQLVPGYEARIVGTDGKDLPPGEIGMLWVEGDSAAECYFQDHEKSKQVFRADWVVSGDLFSRDESGHFFYHGRADDLLKVSGIWVSPLEIEECLLKHAAVRECCVVGHTDEDGLVKPKAFIVLKAGARASAALEAELKIHVKAHLAPHKYPRFFEFPEDLPKNDRGKIDRKALRARLERA